QAAQEQRLIAQRLGIEPESWAARKQAIARVLGVAVLRDARRLLIGRRHHHAFHRLLDIPAVGAELQREPVQQLWMAGWLTLSAEVVARRHQARAEALLPEAIDRDASRKRILRSEQPLGEAESVLAGARRQRRQEAWRVALDLRTLLIVLAALEHVRGPLVRPL